MFKLLLGDEAINGLIEACRKGPDAGLSRSYSLDSRPEEYLLFGISAKSVATFQPIGGH